MKSTCTIGPDYGSLSCQGENTAMEHLSVLRNELKK